MNTIDIKEEVRKKYGAVARSNATASCCGGPSSLDQIGEKIGYSAGDLASVPEGANLGLGCGNPVALASLKEGETVLDLGSGAGFDCFLAAKRVGPSGNVIGVDMTDDMIEKARANAEKGGYANVEFRKGDIEKLPVDDESVDAIISNCVINLSTDKRAVFQEAYRVLKPGGRAMISDLVFNEEPPDILRESVDAYTGCIGGAIVKADYIRGMKDAGFTSVEIVDETTYPVDFVMSDPTIRQLAEAAQLSKEELAAAANLVSSAKILAIK